VTAKSARIWAWTRRAHRKLLMALAVAVGATAAVGGLAAVFGGTTTGGAACVYYTVKRGDLPITVTERGNLESQENIKICCEVDDVRNDGVDGTPILWIIPNGASVKKGDLLIEFNEASHREQLDGQILATERARAEYLQAVARYENRKTQNETIEANAELAVKLAQLELEMFQDAEKGTYQHEVEDIQRRIHDLQNDILAAKGSLQLKLNEKLGIEALFKMGYAGKSELDRARLEFLQAESQYAARLNGLTTLRASLERKRSYEYDMRLLRLQGTLATARRNLEQVELDNNATMAQVTAAKNASERALKKEEERRERYEENIRQCKVYAPQDGMVAYAVETNRRREIAAGVSAHDRQHLLSLPDLQKMQVKTAVHESVLKYVKQGLPAVVTIDAFPDLRYRATVQSVAVLPDPGGWMNSDTKVYETVVQIDEDVARLKPGMTAVVEILVDRLENVLSVPVQAIVQENKMTWCYVESSGGVERREVELGQTNTILVEVREGLTAGERIVLNPSVLSEESEPSTEFTSATSGEEQMAEGRSGGTVADRSARHASAAPRS
jgi:HlyD family secretion protein